MVAVKVLARVGRRDRAGGHRLRAARPAGAAAGRALAGDPSPVLRAVPLTLAALASVAAIAGLGAHARSPRSATGSDTAYGFGFVAMALVCCPCLAAWTAAAVAVARRLELASLRLRLQAQLAGAAGAGDARDHRRRRRVVGGARRQGRVGSARRQVRRSIGPGGLEASEALTLHPHSLTSSPVTPQLLLAGALMAIASALAVSAPSGPCGR